MFLLRLRCFGRAAEEEARLMIVNSYLNALDEAIKVSDSVELKIVLSLNTIKID